MLRISLLFLATAALWAQTAAQKGPEPPPDVDKALRARVIEFCELHKQGKFRQAEAMVADDTKDYFYNSGKPRYLSYELVSITYNEDFTKAMAIVICEHNLPGMGFQGKTVKLRTPFHWKIENGQWMWYMEKAELSFSPFSNHRAAPPSGAATPPAPGAPPAPSATPPPAPMIPASVEQFYSMIKADKSALILKRGASGEVTITNGTPGLVYLQITQKVAGVEAKLDNTAVRADGKAVLTVQAGEQAAAGTLQLQVKPIGPQIAIKVTVE